MKWHWVLRAGHCKGLPSLPEVALAPVQLGIPLTTTSRPSQLRLERDGSTE